MTKIIQNCEQNEKKKKLAKNNERKNIKRM